jgi:hypothetical protein
MEIREPESLAPSLRLRFAGRLFQTVGTGGLLAVAVAVAAIASAGESMRELTQQPLTLAIALGTCVSFFVTGAHLLRKSRRAGATAAITFAWPIASAVVSPGLLTAGTLALCIGGVALIGSVWRELDR